MKKYASLVLIVVLTCMMGLTAFAAGKSPVIEGFVTAINKATDKNGNVVEANLQEVEDKDLIEDIRVTFRDVLKKAGIEVTKGMEVVDVKDVSVPEGTEFPVTIMFKAAGVTPETKVQVLHYTGTEWEVVKSEAGKGTITATFTSLSPVAFVIDKDTMAPVGSTSTEAPRTGMGMAVPMAMAIAVIAGIGFVALGKKKVR